MHEYRGFKAQNQGAKARRAKKIPDAPARPGRRKADSLKVSASSPRPEESIARIPERFGAAVREISNPKKSARNTIVLSGTCHARKNGRNRGSGALTKARADMDGGGGTSSEFNGLQDARIAAINRESLRKKFTFADLKKIRTATLAVLFHCPALRVNASVCPYDNFTKKHQQKKQNTTRTQCPIIRCRSLLNVFFNSEFMKSSIRPPSCKARCGGAAKIPIVTLRRFKNRAGDPLSTARGRCAFKKAHLQHRLSCVRVLQL